MRLVVSRASGCSIEARLCVAGADALSSGKDGALYFTITVTIIVSIVASIIIIIAIWHRQEQEPSSDLLD